MFATPAMLPRHFPRAIVGANPSGSPAVLRAARAGTMVRPSRGGWEGRGRIRLGDTLWRVSGPDLAVGTRVRVTAVRDTELVVAEER